MNEKEIIHSINILEKELWNKEEQRSKILAGTELSASLDKRFNELKEMIEKLSQKKIDLNWSEALERSEKNPND